jgi:Fe-S-cluster containining protein
MLTDTLCTQCGLCCDGSLLGDVELSGPAEAARLEMLGLEVDDDEIGAEVLPLPCAGLCGTRCSIYAHRPTSCRQFQCRLLQDAQRGLITVEESLAAIGRARAEVQRVETLLAALETNRSRLPLKERCAEAIAEARGTGADAAPACEALETAMADLAHTIRGTFLGPEI